MKGGATCTGYVARMILIGGFGMPREKLDQLNQDDGKGNQWTTAVPGEVFTGLQESSTTRGESFLKFHYRDRAVGPRRQMLRTGAYIPL